MAALREWMGGTSDVSTEQALSSLIWIALPCHATAVLLPGLVPLRLRIDVVRNLTRWLGRNGITTPRQLCGYLDLASGGGHAPYQHIALEQSTALLRDAGCEQLQPMMSTAREACASGARAPAAVENRTAVPFFADAEEQLGSTKVGFFIPPVPAGHELSGDELFAGGAKHFECFSGQNLHNPLKAGHEG